MDEPNGDCFEHHESLFAPLSNSDTEHDCLKDFLLDNGQPNLPGGYCYDNGLQNIMPALSMPTGSGFPLGHMPTSHGLTMQSMPLMGCGLPMSHNVSMSMAGGSGLAMSQNPCMPLSSNTNLSIPNQILPMSSPSALSMNSNPGMTLPMSTMPTCSPIPVVSEHSVPPGRPLLDHLSSLPIPNLPSCVNDNPVMMHQAYQPNHLHHMSQLKSPVQLANTNLDFLNAGHSVESVVSSALDNGIMPLECSEKNGEWSPADTGDSVRTGESQEGVEPGTSERTVSSDCVSSETLCSPEAEGILELGNEERKLKQETRGRKRKTAKQPRQKKSPSTIATYHSQIPPDQNGIRITIKKSLTVAPQKPRKRRNKPKEEIEVYQEPLEQTPWGDKMPKKVLNNIFYMVTKIEGCVPFLVRYIYFNYTFYLTAIYSLINCGTLVGHYSLLICAQSKLIHRYVNTVGACLYFFLKFEVRSTCYSNKSL